MNLVKGGKYNWKNQPERLVYLGKKGSWHQFAKIEYPDTDPEQGYPNQVWCEVLDGDLHMLEETVTEPVKPEKVVTPTHDSSDWGAAPELYLQIVGTYKEEIAKGRAALETAGAQSITFYYAGEPEGAGFICPCGEGQEEVARYTEEEGGEPQPYSFDPMNYEITWQGPHLRVTAHDAALTWDAKHGGEELWMADTVC